MSRTKPIIGITCGEVHNKVETWSPVVFGQSRTYVDCVIQAGGVPILLPLTDDDALLEQLSTMIDGLLLSGGNDLNPKLYGQEPLPTTKDYSALRDATEIKLLRKALTANKPVLGVCRGMQLLNIYFGGMLRQMLDPDVPGGLDHDESNKLKTLVDLSHVLSLKSASRLAHILGPEHIGANAHHHQSIDKLGSNIDAVAWARDEVIEAIELPDYAYVLGVQPHPESLTEVEPRWQKLFNSFVQAAGKG